ncbi:MAG: T9SS type A sorting domain-containing protein [Candidatus Kapaibacterium sp.]
MKYLNSISFLTLLMFVNISLAQMTPLPTQTSSIFSGSGNCATCHTGNGIVLTENGVDISPITHWRSSMMGNSSKDPFWRAIVAEEIHEHPQFQFIIESTCTKCHAPMGHRQAIQNGDSGYTMSQMKADPLANDGVSCTSCHQIKNTNFGSSSSYTGGYNITTERIIYGPYPNPLVQPMITFVNYTAVHSTSMNNSELCATCHTLFTPTVNYSGQIVGSFPEQTPYIEWKNSNYKTYNVPCQTCHMPITNTPIDISSIPPFDTTKRSPYWKHLFGGGNTMLNRIMRNNIDSLQLSASASNFDTTLVYTERMLKETAVNLTITPAYSSGFINIGVTVENLAGHKLPTGIPYRRMWVHFKVKDQSNNIIFESGNWDTQGEIIGLDSLYEQHYSEITNTNQVQIYEGAFKDINGNFTFNLLRSAAFLKDNRLPPKGFNTSHPSYDTIAIVGGAVSDTNFNRQGTTQGTGRDIIYYKVPAVTGSQYTISAELCYQTIPPRLVTYIQGISSPDIQKFVSLYNTADKSPVIMKTVSVPFLTGVNPIGNITPASFKLYQNYPNPFNLSTKIRFDVPNGNKFISLKIYDVLGKEVRTLVAGSLIPGSYETDFDAKDLSSGMFFCVLRSESFYEIKRMMFIK